MIDPHTLEGWRNAAKSDNYSQYIHPTGHSKEAYEQSGKQYADMILEHVKEGDLVLDYGCGNGRVLKHIREPKIGIDIVPEAAAMVGGFTPDKYKGKVDVIYSVNVLIHNSYENGCKIIEWMHGRLKKKGKLLLQIPIYDKAKEPGNWTDVGVWTIEMFKEAVKDFDILDAQTNPGKFTFENIGPNHFKFHTLVKK
jgi:cyclopropane fatty-acyl-phospholipid synthase-like methyltransferase